MCSHPQNPLLLNPLLFPCSKLLFSSQLGPNAGLALARTLAENSVASGVFQSRGFPSLQSFPEDPRPHGSRILCETIEPAPYLAPAVLAKNLFPIPRLASGMLSPQDGPSLCLSCSPLEGPSPVSDRHPMGLTSRRKVVMTDVSNSGWGALCKRRPPFGSWSMKVAITAEAITLLALPSLEDEQGANLLCLVHALRT